MAERLSTNTFLVDVLDRVLFKGLRVELNGPLGFDRSGLSGRVVGLVEEAAGELEDELWAA